MAVTISYARNVIATVTSGQTATVNCDGKEMKGNISVDVVQDAPNLTVGTFIFITGSTTQSCPFVKGMTWDMYAQVVWQPQSIGEIRNDRPFYYPAYGYVYLLPASGDPPEPQLSSDVIVDGQTYTVVSEV